MPPLRAAKATPQGAPRSGRERADREGKAREGEKRGFGGKTGGEGAPQVTGAGREAGGNRIKRARRRAEKEKILIVVAKMERVFTSVSFLGHIAFTLFSHKFHFIFAVSLAVLQLGAVFL